MLTFGDIKAFLIEASSFPHCSICLFHPRTLSSFGIGLIATMPYVILKA